MNREQLIEKIASCLDLVHEKYAEDVLTTINQAGFYLVRKEAVKIVDYSKDPKFEYDRGVYIEATPRGKPEINKGDVL